MSSWVLMKLQTQDSTIHSRFEPANVEQTSVLVGVLGEYACAVHFSSG